MGWVVPGSVKPEKSEHDILEIHLTRGDLRMLLILLGTLAHQTPLPAELQRLREDFQQVINEEVEDELQGDSETEN